MEKPLPGVLIPAGFASLEQAEGWELRGERAVEAIDSLWLQRCLYGLERALASPCLAGLMLFASEELPGFELVAFVDVGAGREELEALQARSFLAKRSGEPIVDAPPDGQLEALRTQLRLVERWSRERPGMLRGARALGPLSAKVPLGLAPHASWADIALALGAGQAMAAMERAQLDASAESAGGSREARRI